MGEMRKKITATIGFIFNPDFSQVLLITKNRPTWQAGLVNGLGGKCEMGETTVECVTREIYEEAKLAIPAQNWQYITQIIWAEWKVEIFATVFHGHMNQAQSQTDELIAWYSVGKLPSNVMSNLRWLIPLSIDVMTKENPPQVSVRYAD